VRSIEDHRIAAAAAAPLVDFKDSTGELIEIPGAADVTAPPRRV
jgi:hypothetical protein